MVALFGGAGGAYSYSYDTYHSGYRRLQKTAVGQENDLTRKLSSVEIDVL